MKVQAKRISARTAAQPAQCRAGERGAALITALLFMVLLTALGLATVMTSSTEIMTSSNDRHNKLALDHANAGLQMALAALEARHLGYPGKRGVHLSSTDPDTDYGKWFLRYRGYTTIDATPQIVDTDLGNNYYETVVEFKKEDSVHTRDGVDNNEVVTYSRDCGYPDAPIEDWRKAFPVYVVTSKGYVKANAGVPDDQALATAVVTTEITKNTMNVEVAGALQANCVSGNGNINITGESNCEDAPPAIPVGTYPDPSIYPHLPPDQSVCSDSPIDDVAGHYTHDSLDTGVYSSGDAEPVTPENNLGMSLSDLEMQAYGRYYETAGPWPPDLTSAMDVNDKNNIYYVKPDATGSWGLTGGDTYYGILIVDGDFTIGGTVTWNGIVYVTGSLAVSTGGNVSINGDVMVEGDADIHGNLGIGYDCDGINKLSNMAFNSKMLNWERTYEALY